MKDYVAWIIGIIIVVAIGTTLFLGANGSDTIQGQTGRIAQDQVTSLKTIRP